MKNAGKPTDPTQIQRLSDLTVDIDDPGIHEPISSAKVRISEAGRAGLEKEVDDKQSVEQSAKIAWVLNHTEKLLNDRTRGSLLISFLGSLM